MMLAWMTDVHFDHLSPHRFDEFIRSWQKIECDAFLITGDISNGERVVDDVQRLVTTLQKPVYFVLGNHDYYGSSTERVRWRVQENLKDPNAVCLGQRSYVRLSSTTALVGHDTWYDAVYGDWRISNFSMCDWVLIEDYTDIGAAINGGHGRALNPNYSRIVGKSRALALQGVEHISAGIDAAINDGFKRIIIASHVPPFDDAHMYEGKKGDDGAQPWFTSGLLGELLKQKAIANPEKIFSSLSGHTHGSYEGMFAHNLHVRVGGARYGHPEVQGIIEL